MGYPGTYSGSTGWGTLVHTQVIRDGGTNPGTHLVVRDGGSTLGTPPGSTGWGYYPGTSSIVRDGYYQGTSSR